MVRSPNSHFACTLITHDHQTQVRELCYAECSESYVFRGGKEYSQKQVQDMLGLSTTVRAGQPVGTFGAARLLLPVQH